MPVQDCENFSTSMCYIAVLCKQLLYSLAAESLMIKAPQQRENFSTSMCYIAVLCKQLLYSLAAESLMIKAPQQHSISTQTAKPRSLDNSKAQHSKVLVHKVCTVAT